MSPLAERSIANFTRAVRRGEFDQAVTGLQQALEICHTWQLRMQMHPTVCALSYAQASAGRNNPFAASSSSGRVEVAITSERSAPLAKPRVAAKRVRSLPRPRAQVVAEQQILVAQIEFAVPDHRVRPSVRPRAVRLFE